MLPEFQTEQVERTVDGFGYEWATANPLIHNKRFTSAETFLDFIAPVSETHFRGEVVLDAGCGTGRFSMLAQSFGAKLVVGVDLGSSVDVAFTNTRKLRNVLIVQADLFELPLRQAFDYAFSVGVLHHTRDPADAFGAVLSKVKAGGSISAWIYGREGNGWVISVLNPIRRHLTSRLPHRVLLVLSYFLTALLYLPLELVYRPVGNNPRLGGCKRFLFYFDYLYFMSQFGFHEQAVGIVFDQLVPTIAEYIPRDEFQQWFDANGLEDVTISSRAGNSWRGFGRLQTLIGVA
jgi:SAM-dependent methyltransferase